MTLGECALLFGSNFAFVFLAGVQSRNVNGGKYAGAAVTSLCLAGFQVVNVRGTVAADPWVAFAIIGTSGPLGILCAMSIWSRVFNPRSKLCAKS